MKIKNFVLVVLFVFVAGFGFVSCKSDLIRGENREADTVEILYERVLPVVSPQYDDPTGLGIFSNNYGGFSCRLEKVGENKWMGSIDLRYTKMPYMVFVMDARVFRDGYVYTGRKFFVRIRGQDQWIELTRVVPIYDGEGEQAEFILNAGVIIANF